MSDRPRRRATAPSGGWWLALLLAGWCSGADAGGVVVITGAELARAGATVATPLPDGSVVVGPAMRQECAALLPGDADLVVYAVASGACRIASTVHDALAVPGSYPVLALGGVEAASAAECLDHRAVLYAEVESALVYCLGWSECPNLDVVITGASEICSGDETVLDAGDGWASYLWTPGGATTRLLAVAPVSSTQYQVEVVDEDGCGGTSPPHVLTVLACAPVFTDGFESGGLDGWSSSVP